MINDVNVKGTASKIAKADLAVTTLNLKIADKDIEKVTEKYNNFYRKLKDLVSIFDNEARISVSGLGIITDDKAVESIFRFMRNTKMCYATASISITYEDTELMYNKVLSFCEQNKEELEDKKGTSCLMYSCSKSAKVSKKLYDEIRAELIKSALEDALRQVRDVYIGSMHSIAEVGSDIVFDDGTIEHHPGAATTKGKDARRISIPLGLFRLMKADVEPMYVSGLGGSRRYKGACMDTSIGMGNTGVDLEVEQGDIYSQFSISVRATYSYLSNDQMERLRGKWKD